METLNELLERIATALEYFVERDKEARAEASQMRDEMREKADELYQRARERLDMAGYPILRRND